MTSNEARSRILTRRQIDESRFWSYVDIGDDDTCWMWLGGTDGLAYGQSSFDGRTQRAHRIAWTIANGSAPAPGKLICHGCNQPLCVNPSHLYAGTHADNALDRHVERAKKLGQALLREAAEEMGVDFEGLVR